MTSPTAARRARQAFCEQKNFTSELPRTDTGHGGTGAHWQSGTNTGTPRSTHHGSRLSDSCEQKKRRRLSLFYPWIVLPKSCSCQCSCR